ncbi:YIP1 family protein [Candidatus Viridilinea mediisalina]|uniref:Yip1 domain-containing protein n=1 Tax=Candidatus Viridilinea mediisalina TaxID=2024553 RepID=A0A2A6RLV6_9CHLR|nr:YIP1 family protein [Candidatus Viridilinea mediisalina]PDW03881.1 hypothetical protein CJ255_06410 [Candidatus Viridilinea mediisalina]
MDSIKTTFQLALGGLLLDPAAFREQRDAPDGFARGALLVALIGLLVGVAAWIGNLGVYATQPDATEFSATLYDGITSLPLYQNMVAESPEIGIAFEEAFSQPQDFGVLAAGPAQSFMAIFFTPVFALLGWFLFGSVVHIAARAFGGAATYQQTMACTALASGANLLALVQIVPYAQVAATTTLGLIATYVAVRESHQLPAWPTFWAVALGPTLLLVLLGTFFCCFLLLLVSAVA